MPEAQRNDAIRQALADRPRDTVAIATMVELLGRDVVGGPSASTRTLAKGSEYDLDFKMRGGVGRCSENRLWRQPLSTYSRTEHSALAIREQPQPQPQCGEVACSF